MGVSAVSAVPASALPGSAGLLLGSGRISALPDPGGLTITVTGLPVSVSTPQDPDLPDSDPVFAPNLPDLEQLLVGVRTSGGRVQGDSAEVGSGSLWEGGEGEGSERDGRF